MPKLEGINLERINTPEQELAKEKKAVSETSRRVFAKIATSVGEIFNEDKYNLSPERRQELNANLGELSMEAKNVLKGLPETDEADSHRYDMAA